MFNLLGVSLIQFLKQPLTLTGCLLLVVGISTAFLARRIARVARKSNNIPNNDKVYVALKIIGLLFVVAGFVCIAVHIILYIVNR